MKVLGNGFFSSLFFGRGIVNRGSYLRVSRKRLLCVWELLDRNIYEWNVVFDLLRGE